METANDTGAEMVQDDSQSQLIQFVLQDFFDNNDNPAVAQTARVLRTLLSNALKDNSKRTIRLTNKKIQAQVVNISGAMSILLSCGFIESGESLLFQDNGPSQRQFVELVCQCLSTKILELAPKPTKTMPSMPKDSKRDEQFLCEKERRERAEKIRKQKLADKEHRKMEKQRWLEDAEERKVLLQRREASNKINADNLGPNINVRVGEKRTTGVLAKPFQPSASHGDFDAQAARRQLIQETMRDAGRTKQQKQQRMQELMKMTPDALKIEAANKVVSSDNATTNPATKETASETAASTAMIQDLIKARAPRAPSSEWSRFLDGTPRCAGAANIRDTSVFHRHHSASPGFNAPKCLKRLFRELDGLKDSLPSDHNCSIWLRFDEDSPQYIRALLAAPLPGPTPYSGGLFAFDIYVPDDYPHTNPRCQLLTTGGGSVRFGPNLYADGKVCLSLLGTWDGPKWSPKHSSLYQLLISIQGLILGVEHPFFLEPGHGGWEGKIKAEGEFTKKGHTLAGHTVTEEVGLPLNVVMFEDKIRIGTARYAMLEPLKYALTPRKNGSLEAFASIIQAHFKESAEAILVEVRSWTNDSALGRDRSNAEQMKFPIDSLIVLLPKLENLLSKVSILSDRSSASSGMDVEDSHKPASPPAMKKPPLDVAAKKPAALPSPTGPLDKKLDDSSSEDEEGDEDEEVQEEEEEEEEGQADYLESKRRQMQEAASAGDYVRAGELQHEVLRLEDLRGRIEAAAARADYIAAGRLQAQYQALTATTKARKRDTGWRKPKSAPAMPPAAAVPPAASYESESDYSSGEDDDDEMSWDEGGFGGAAPGSHLGGPPQGLPSHFGKNIYGNSAKRGKWGAGNRLGDAVSPPPQPPAPSRMAEADEEDNMKMPAIDPEELCRLRIRLPDGKNVVHDFKRTDPLSEVYRRVGNSLAPDGGGQSKGGPPRPASHGGTFAQPLSESGFTLLLTHPRREFSLEVEGSRTLSELNLFPSATLSVMPCNARGVAVRGEVESRLLAAQGDAMDVDGLSYEALSELTERVGGAERAIDEAAFEASTLMLSVAEYLSLKAADGGDDDGGEEGESCCLICLGTFDASAGAPTLLRIKACGHTFHSACLRTWVLSNPSCPICKAPIV
mmetsp:Transcript_27180/g.61949  ORF Transcript_27180/g.61949 Transcript_27180/m.61949 type:complete len:1130 (-) Transcript_27180:90-3479(-)